MIKKVFPSMNLPFLYCLILSHYIWIVRIFTNCFFFYNIIQSASYVYRCTLHDIMKYKSFFSSFYVFIVSEQVLKIKSCFFFSLSTHLSHPSHGCRKQTSHNFKLSKAHKSPCYHQYQQHNQTHLYQLSIVETSSSSPPYWL